MTSKRRENKNLVRFMFFFPSYKFFLTKGKKGKVTLFNVGSSLSYETGINGSRRCALYPPTSVSAPFYGYSKLWLHGSEESRSRR